MEHAELIDALGGSGVLSKVLVNHNGEHPKQSAVSMWKTNGVAHKWRGVVESLARERGIIDLPAGWNTGG